MGDNWIPETFTSWERNKVHVNPNFHKQNINSQPLPSSSLMHVNPKFSHLLPNIQTNNVLNKNKIYVNPNFIRLQNASEIHGITENNVKINCNDNKIEHIPTAVTSTTATASMSRYSLVRHNKNIRQNLMPEINSRTVKLGKYKLVQVNYIKKTLGVVRCANDCHKHTERDKWRSIAVMQKASAALPNIYESRFKLIKQNAETNISPKSPIVKKVPTRKQMKFINQQVRAKSTKGKFKKNNIPCPQFRKFGKCLRNTNGKCEFLHDRKHVSICRKFIKGLCHDLECLLSHELTAKKMPTCHFYLNGICTKENCPYLHIKLNEKSKICRDFLNGYCEKGTECLNRHEDVQVNEVRVGASKRLYSFRNHAHKSDGKASENKPKDGKETDHKVSVNMFTKTTNMSQKILSKETTDCRYYQEPINENSNHDNQCALKPTRCKLGTLPSYIQF